MNKYEQLIEHIINDETDKARELFHTIVVEKSRDIYESLIDEQDLEEVGGNQVQGLADEVTIDEQGISEEEDSEEGDDLGALDSTDGEGEFGGEEQGEAEIEDRVVDLEDALDELKAEFDALMAGEEHEEHAEPGIHGDEGHEMGGEEEQSEFFEAKDEDEEEVEESAEEVEEDKEVVKEYVEKVAAPSNTAAKATSPVAKKNDMGGTAASSKGGNANPDGNSPDSSVKPKGELLGKNLATPGAKAGSAFAKKETAVKKEEGAVNATSPLAK